MWKDFRTFIARGNVLDLAVGIIIGGAFGKIITSLVNDIVMPPIGLLLGRVNFADRYLNLTPHSYPSLAAAKAAGAATINYGTFINTLLDFFIVAFVIFLMMRQFLRWQRPQPAPTQRACPYCLSSIPKAATRCAFCTAEVPASE